MSGGGKIRPDVSASRAGKFRRCPRAHRHAYVDRWPDDTTSPARVGKACHGAIELAAQRAVAALQAGAAGGPVLDAAALRDALLDVGAQHVESPRELMDALAVLERAAPIALGRVLGVELAWTLEAEGVLLGGVWDLVHEITDEQALTCVEVIDWKTGEAPPLSLEEAEDDLQVGLYLDGLRAWVGPHDTRELRVSLVYLSHEDRETGGPVTRTVYWSRDRAEAARLTAVADYRAWSSGYDEPRIGRHCGHCPYRERCEPYQVRRGQLEVAPVPPSLPALPPHELLRLRERLREVHSLSEKALVDVNAEIMARIQRDGGKKLVAGGLVASLRERSTGTWPTAAIDAVAQAVGMDRAEAWRRCASVKVTELRKLAKGVPAAQQALERYKPLGSTRYVDVRPAPTPI